MNEHPNDIDEQARLAYEAVANELRTGMPGATVEVGEEVAAKELPFPTPDTTPAKVDRRTEAMNHVRRALAHQQRMFREYAEKLQTDDVTAAAILCQAYQEYVYEKRSMKGIRQAQKRAADIAAVWSVCQMEDFQPAADAPVNVSETETATEGNDNG